MARPQLEIREQKPSSGDPEAMATSIWEISRQTSEGLSRAGRDVKIKAADYVMDPVLDRIILVSGLSTVTLPAAAEADHVEYVVVRTGGSTVTVDTKGGNIVGVAGTAAFVTITTNGASVRVASNGTDYHRTDNL